ncbi:phage major capsid protein [Paraclostridium sordellii]|uniref:phage major capsid protein n=1 Tax=Paraclostridium sordellii TaxID=1505 RepID=UPI0005E0C700|nr:phage major capsid protein [Paeniclostridium sordellii]CEN80994.1 Phage capsid family protein [[Clostridium] sordellii] [Paeniclostridium sordellii]
MADTNYLKDNLKGFVPVEVAPEIMDEIARGSSILQLSDVKPMKSDTMKFQVWADKPGAYWVGETERIKTTKASWIFPEMQAKKIAVIIPVTREKLNDTTIDVFNELKPQIAEAFYTTIDKACLFGTDSPFTKNILGVATSSSNVVTRDSQSLDLDISDVMGKLEDKNYDPNGFVGHYGLKRQIRNLRDANGNQLAVLGMKENSLYDLPLSFVRNGAFNKENAEILCGDWSKSIVGIREGIEFEILKEATLQSVTMGDGKPLSLAENDMIAIKATMRIAYLPIKDDAFAVLKPAL